MPLKPTKWILLDTSLEETMRRVNIRSRDGESKVNIEYQTDLYAKHVEFYHMLKSKGEKTIIVPSNKMNSNFKSNIEIVADIYSIISS
jgi:deoxyadenosine/deoxycytidine kinase